MELMGKEIQGRNPVIEFQNLSRAQFAHAAIAR